MKRSSKARRGLKGQPSGWWKDQMTDEEAKSYVNQLKAAQEAQRKAALAAPAGSVRAFKVTIDDEGYALIERNDLSVVGQTIYLADVQDALKEWWAKNCSPAE